MFTFIFLQSNIKTNFKLQNIYEHVNSFKNFSTTFTQLSAF